MQVWENDIIMHEGTFLSTLTIKTILVLIPCVMPSFCAFSGARSPFVMMPFVNLNRGWRGRTLKPSPGDTK